MSMRVRAKSAVAAGLVLGTILIVGWASAGGEDRVSAMVVEKVEGFTVIGISVRTSNVREMSPDSMIGKQWGRLFQEGVLAKIPNKTNSEIIAVYTDYASDKNGEYTFVLGARAIPGTEAPAGMVAVKIPTGKYAVFTSEKGPAPKVVPGIWQQINSLLKSAPGGDRTYKADFEVYDQRAADPQNSVVDVYIGIK
jgi:predicted transcriptional regulator YdeE